MSSFNKTFPTDDLLIKHFFILGIGTDKILDSKYFSNIKSISDSHKLIPSILSLFPKFPKNHINIDENVLLHHCFPNGFYLHKFSQFPQPNHFFFELDNIPLSNKQSPLYFTCLSFFEPIENYNLFKIIHDKGVNFAEQYLQTPQNSQTNNSNDGTNINCPLIGEGYYIEKIIGFISGEYHPDTLSKILILLHGRYTGHYNEINEPLEKVIESLIFKIPSMKLGKCKLEAILFNKQFNFEYPQVNSIPQSFIQVCKIFEKYDIDEVFQIFKYILLEEPILMFSEKKYELTSTFDAFLSLIYPFKCVVPHCGILPDNSLGLIESCDKFIFGINQNYNEDFFKKNEIQLYNKKIFILDLNKKEIVTMKKFDVIQIDLDNDLEDDFEFFNDNNSSEEKEESKYNYRNMDLNYDMNPDIFKKESEVEINLPAHYKKKTYNNIKDYLQNLGKNHNKSSDHLEADIFSHKLKEQFNYFLVSILLDYANFVKYDFEVVDNYLFNPETNFNIEKLFDVDGFINSHKVDELFYKKFFHTKLFKNFILKKIYPFNLNDKIDILYFDERIADKKNKNTFAKKINTPFMYYQFNSSDYKIFVDSPNFSFNEINYIKNDIYYDKNYFNYYQVMVDIPNSNDIIIKYPIFPKLLYDDYYFGKTYFDLYKDNEIPTLNMNLINQKIKEIKKLIRNPDFNSVYKNINYSLNNLEESKLLMIEQKFYLPNVWIALNALTLNYCNNKEEKDARFSEIIEKLYEIVYIEPEIIFLILIIINKYGTSEQILITFAKILKNKILLNNYSLYSIVLTNLTKNFNSNMYSSKTNIISSRAAILNKKDNNMEILNRDNIKFPKRGIYSHDEEIQESIEFGLQTMCCYCRKLNHINYSLLMEQKGKTEGTLLQCGSCKKNFSPRMKVNINNTKIESFELLSCWDLLEFIKNEFMTTNIFNIDVINFKKNYEEFFWNCVFYFSMNGLNFEFLTPYVKDISENFGKTIYINNNLNTQFSDLYYENTAKVSYNEGNNNGNMVSNYKHPFIKMNSGKK